MFEYHAILERWIDGDTVLVKVDLGFSCFREERIRLARINAWELNSSSSYQKRIAISVRAKAKKMFPENSKIIIQTKKNPVKDMYARYIAEIVCNGANVSDALMKLKGINVFEAK